MKVNQIVNPGQQLCHQEKTQRGQLDQLQNFIYRLQSGICISAWLSKGSFKHRHKRFAKSGLNSDAVQILNPVESTCEAVANPNLQQHQHFSKN